ncbi:MAG: insulinase family protein [Mogibacterium sp.]|nr:insulinase family protein [Mogibacterium sp.]
MKLNDKLHGFTVTNIREIKEIGGRLIEMEHDVTGAKLAWADNGDENKLFSVGFRTIPEDSTGVFHILEHSVLCGSENYPVKEPFVELLKTSMNTFLNAMTFPDKTLYPVSSRIEQDYLNLMGVYLDAVFRPNILHDPNIFYQEGWHIDTTEGEPVFKGVVFNEMKGAMSEVDSIADRHISKLLFPEYCYGYNSGGDPDEIPELSYDSFIERYKRFYHPSNSYFYLDGDVPIDKTLEMIESYLAGYGRREDLPVFVPQVPVKSERTIDYAVSSEDDKPMICFGKIIGSWEDRDKMLALSVILEQMADSNESPLKRAVLSSGLAEDMEIYVSDGIAQPYLVMIFRGITAEDGSKPDKALLDSIADKLLTIVEDTIKKTTDEGFSKRDLEASVNQTDFRFRQYPEPQALYRAMALFSSWLYDGDPALYLNTDEAIANVRSMIDGGSMEALALEVLGDTSGLSKLILVPSSEYGAKEAAEEAARVRASVEAMSETERRNLEELNSGLIEWQQSEDSEEALATIPQLDLTDIDPLPNLIATEIKDAGSTKVIFHPVASNGIVYINAYFPITQLTQKDLPAAALITEFYKDLPTENFSVLALQNEIRMYVGAMSFGLDILAKDNDRESCTPCIRVRASVLEDKLSYAEDLMIEILTRTKFDDKAMMRELITQIDEDSKRSAIGQGHKLAMAEARSHWSARDAAAEAVNGYSFMQYMHSMSNASDEDLEAFTSFAKDVIKKSVNRQNAIISVTATEYADVSRLVEMLPEGEKMPEKAHYVSTLPRRMGIDHPAAVSFAVTAYDMNEDGHRMNGSMQVASNIISLSYLWNTVRVQGGAYGTSMNAGRTGSVHALSFRDPTPARSLGIFGSLAEFLDGFATSGDNGLDGFIISTIANAEPLMSPSSKGRMADDFFLSGFTDEDRIRIRREMLETKASDFTGMSAVLKDLAEKGTVCVAGPRSALEACEDLEIVSL